MICIISESVYTLLLEALALLLFFYIYPQSHYLSFRQTTILPEINMQRLYAHLKNLRNSFHLELDI